MVRSKKIFLITVNNKRYKITETIEEICEATEPVETIDLTQDDSNVIDIATVQQEKEISTPQQVVIDLTMDQKTEENSLPQQENSPLNQEESEPAKTPESPPYNPNTPGYEFDWMNPASPYPLYCYSPTSTYYEPVSPEYLPDFTVTESNNTMLLPSPQNVDEST